MKQSARVIAEFLREACEPIPQPLHHQEPQDIVKRTPVREHAFIVTLRNGDKVLVEATKLVEER